MSSSSKSYTAVLGFTHDWTAFPVSDPTTVAVWPQAAFRDPLLHQRGAHKSATPVLRSVLPETPSGPLHTVTVTGPAEPHWRSDGSRAQHRTDVTLPASMQPPQLFTIYLLGFTDGGKSCQLFDDPSRATFQTQDSSLDTEQYFIITDGLVNTWVKSQSKLGFFC